MAASQRLTKLPALAVRSSATPSAMAAPAREARKIKVAAADEGDHRQSSPQLQRSAPVRVRTTVHGLVPLRRGTERYSTSMAPSNGLNKGAHGCANSAAAQPRARAPRFLNVIT